MQLVEQGKLDLDADVNQYLDFEIPAYEGKPATLRQIMTHTAGFEEQIRALITAKDSVITPLGEALKHWVPERIHEPGSTPAYSNYATAVARSEEHTSELQSLMRISYAVFCLKKKTETKKNTHARTKKEHIS